MTDEQNPTGDQPQDPAQTPIPGQQPPTTPPPAPVNPYDQQPATPDPAAPGAPPPPAYGQPQYSQPQYGQPAYGQPQYAAPQPGMPGVPAFPGGPVEAKPSRAMAITALVLSLIFCIPVLGIIAVVLGVIVVVGKKAGRGMAIAAIIIGLLATLAQVAAIIGLASYDWDSLLPVEQLKTGDCINASNLTDDDEDFVEDIKEVGCTKPHDAEVLVTKKLTQDDAKDYDPASSTLCTDLLTAGGLAGKIGPDVGYFGLTTDSDPNAGDKLVCIAYKTDGSKLDAPL